MTAESNQNIHPNISSTDEIKRVLAGMQDALTDEMVMRLSATASKGMTLLDQIGRSDLDKVITVISRMSENGDLERLAQLARVAAAMQDALTDEMLVRLVDTVSQALIVFERMNHAGLDKLITMLPRILEIFEQLENNHVIDNLVDSMNKAAIHSKEESTASGGVRGLWKLSRQPESQDALRYLLLVCNNFRVRSSNQ